MGYTHEEIDILFGWEHQRAELKPVTQSFNQQAHDILERVANSDNPLVGRRTTIAINKLLEAKDEAVRALAFHLQDTDE